MSHTSGNSWQRLLVGSGPSETLGAGHVEVCYVVWVAAAGPVLVAAEVVERTLRRRKDGRPWVSRYTGLVARAAHVHATAVPTLACFVVVVRK